MARLPTPGADADHWGDILNAYLSVSHNADGTLNASAVTYGTTAGTAAQGNDSRITGALQAATFTTKGDLLAASASATANRLGVGANGQVLTADSSQSVGVKWAAIGGGPTLVVAAANSRSSRSADYICTGTNDHLVIQQAINLAQSTSTQGTVLLLDGTFNLGGPLTIAVGKGLQVLGSGWGTVLALANGVNDYAIKFAGTADMTCRFAYFVLDGNAANQTAGGGILASAAVQCIFENLHITKCYTAGLNINGGAIYGHHNRVVSCLFDNHDISAGSGQGIQLVSSDENFMLACDFENMGGSGVDPIMILDKAGVQHIVACNFVGGSHNCIAIRVQDANATRVVSCTFDAVAGDSVFIAGSRNVISSNAFTSVGLGSINPGDSSGVHLEYGAKYNLVVDNLFQTATPSGRTRSLVREENMGGSGYNNIQTNTFFSEDAPAVANVEASAPNSIVRNNQGWITEAMGTATVANGTTSIVVNHGLSRAPALSEISLTPTNNLGSATKFWVSNPTGTQFTINTDVNPGVSTATFSWQVG